MPLISSAAAGKKLAPKAPARRRQAAVVQAATAAINPDETPDTTSGTTLPSPPPTQEVLDTQTRHAAPSLDTDRPIAEPSVNVADKPDQVGHIESHAAPRSQDYEHNVEPGVSPNPRAQPNTRPAPGTPHELEAEPVPEPDPEPGPVPQPVLEPVSEHEPESRPERRPGSVPESAPQSEPGPQLRTQGRTNEEHSPAGPAPVEPSDQTPHESARTQATDDATELPNTPSLATNRSQNQGQQATVSPTQKRARKTAAGAESSRPVKRVKNNSVRSNATIQASSNVDQLDVSHTGAFAEAADDSPNLQQPQAVRKGSRRQVKSTATGKRKKPQKPAASSDGVENTQRQAGSPGPVDQEPVQKKRRKRRKQSEVTDADADQQSGDDPEQHEIDPATLSMFALSHDHVHGKTSEREKKMAAINWEEVAQKRKEEASRIVAGHQASANGDAAPSTEKANGRTEDGSEERPSQSGTLQFTIDAAGNIVADESSLRINRQEAVEEAERRGDPVEDVNDLTIRINRATWVNDSRRDPADRVPMWRSKSDPWSEEETDQFYEALRMFGTDFGILSKMFAGKTRKHVKLKFTREERLDPIRLNNALSGKETKPMNLEHYARATGTDISVYTKYDSVAHALSLINDSMKDKQMELTAAAAEEAALEKQRLEREKQKALEKKQAAKKPRKKRGMGGGTLGGAPVDEE